MRKLIPAFVLLAACNNGHAIKVYIGNPDSVGKIMDSVTEIRTAPDVTLQIVPGRHIGHTSINESIDSVIAQLGKPDSSDAAMGAVMCTWVSHNSGYRTDVYAHHNYGAKDENIAHVKLIRVSSPAFKTDGGLGVGSSLNTIINHYPVKPIATYLGKDSIDVYDNAANGIAFEITNGKCAAILIHAPGDSGSSYISMHPDMQRIDKNAATQVPVR